MRWCFSSGTRESPGLSWRLRLFAFVPLAFVSSPARNTPVAAPLQGSEVCNCNRDTNEATRKGQSSLTSPARSTPVAAPLQGSEALLAGFVQRMRRERWLPLPEWGHEIAVVGGPPCQHVGGHVAVAVCVRARARVCVCVRAQMCVCVWGGVSCCLCGLRGSMWVGWLVCVGIAHCVTCGWFQIIYLTMACCTTFLFGFRKVNPVVVR